MLWRKTQIPYADIQRNLLIQQIYWASIKLTEDQEESKEEIFDTFSTVFIRRMLSIYNIF